MDKQKASKTGLIILAVMLVLGLIVFGMSMMLERDRTKDALSGTEDTLTGVKLQLTDAKARLDESEAKYATAQASLEEACAQLNGALAENEQLKKDAASFLTFLLTLQSNSHMLTES